MSAVPAIPPPVTDEQVADLRARLERFRPVPTAHGGAALGGVDPAWVARMVARWRDGYDWSSREREIRARPWRLIDTAGGPLRVVHHHVADDAPTVVLLHGWRTPCCGSTASSLSSATSTW